MRGVRWAVCLWPGLPRLWFDGALSSLIGALLFAVLLDFCLLSSWIWPELVSQGTRGWAWAATAVIWAVAVLRNRRYMADSGGVGERRQAGDLFPTALDEYLMGRWFEVERLCVKMLDVNGRDAEAGLLLASTLRHAGRLEEARRRLEWVQRLDRAAFWEREIATEYALLKEREQAVHELTVVPEEAPPVQATPGTQIAGEISEAA